MAGQFANKPLAERIFEKCAISDTGCLLWHGYTLNKYGKIRWKGQRLLVHRAMYELRHGEIPDGMCVCHKCDTPNCVNDDHLFLGTRADNNADKVSKGRQSRTGSKQYGMESHFAKLSANQVQKIRKEYAERHTSQYVLAYKFGVSQSQISNIVNQRTWVNI